MLVIKRLIYELSSLSGTRKPTLRQPEVNALKINKLLVHIHTHILVEDNVSRSIQNIDLQSATFYKWLLECKKHGSSKHCDVKSTKPSENQQDSVINVFDVSYNALWINKTLLLVGVDANIVIILGILVLRLMHPLTNEISEGAGQIFLYILLLHISITKSGMAVSIRIQCKFASFQSDPPCSTHQNGSYAIKSKRSEYVNAKTREKMSA